MRQIIITCTIVLIAFCVQAQENQKSGITPTFQLNYLYGDVKNPIKIPNQTNAHYIQLSVTNATGSSEESFFNLYKKPNVGFSALYGYLGQKDVLGSVFTVYPTWEYMFFQDKSFGANIKLGTGFAYFNRPFNKISNPDNQLIGSHFTNVTEISPNVWFKFAPKLYVQSGVALMHFSNGHTSIPNIGLNDVTVRLGVIYKPGTLVGISKPKPRVASSDSMWRKTISISYGRHELAYSTYPVDGPSYNIFKVAGFINKQFRSIHDFSIGLSITYYDSYYKYIRFEDSYKYFKTLHATQTTFHLGHEFLMNRFGFVTEGGIKIFDPFYRTYFLKNENGFSKTSRSLITSKVGFKYYPLNNAFSGKKIAIGMFIKTNFAQADFVEYNVSYTF